MGNSGIQPSFLLPRLACSTDGVLSSFRSQSLKILGFYEPMASPVVVDPIATSNPIPLATAMHEMRHQRLTENTDFGIFHSFLEMAAKRDRSFVDMLRLSMQEQWSVQELDATYGELATVSMLYPQQLQATMETLPSQARDGPPYFEVFSSVARHLPLPIWRDGKFRLLPEDCLVHLLATFAMSTDCLSRFSALSAFSPEIFTQYLSEDAPHTRFERLMNAILRSDSMAELLEMTEEALNSPDPDSATVSILSRLGEIANEPLVDFYLHRKHIDAALDGWGLRRSMDEAGRHFLIEARLPAVMACVSELKSDTREFARIATLTSASLRREFAISVECGEGVFLGLWADGQEARIFFRTFPIVDGDLHPDLSRFHAFESRIRFGVLPLRDVRDILSEVRPLPQILMFGSTKSWEHWSLVSSASEVSERRIWICFTKFGVEQESIKRMLTFRDIGSNARYRFVTLRDDPRNWVFIFNPLAPQCLACLVCPEQTAVSFFILIATRLGLVEAEDDLDPTLEAVMTLVVAVTGAE